jgi:hypothetical protein
MSKVIIEASKLKPEALSATGKQVYGLDEYIYIKSFNYDDNNAIKVSFYVLLKTEEGNYDLIANLSTPDYKYYISDGKAFKDISGYNVYKTDENGDVLMEDVESDSGEVDENDEPIMETKSVSVKRVDDYSRNFEAFATMLIPSIKLDVNNYLGYHNNEGGKFDNPIED